MPRSSKINSYNRFYKRNVITKIEMSDISHTSSNDILSITPIINSTNDYNPGYNVSNDDSNIKNISLGKRNYNLFNIGDCSEQYLESKLSENHSDAIYKSEIESINISDDAIIGTPRNPASKRNAANIDSS